MKSLTGNKGRISIACLWHSPGRTLLHLIIPLLNLSCISAPAFIPSTEQGEGEDQEFFTVRLEHTYPIDRLDILVYEAGGVQHLTMHKTYGKPPETIRLPLPDTDYIIIGIANLTASIRDEAADRYSGMETLSIPFSLEREDFPTLSGITTDRTLSLKPLRSTVVIRSVSNNAEDYSLMENPRARLINIPAEAAILQWSGFRSADVTEGRWHPLPCDIGFFTQYPNIQLHCFPSDDKSGGEGTRHPVLELEYQFNGDTLSAIVGIGPIRRGETLYVDIEV